MSSSSVYPPDHGRLSSAGTPFPTQPHLQVFRKDSRAKMPFRSTEGSIGWDLHAFLLTEGGRPSKKGIGRTETAKVPTGLILRPPPGFFIQICSRSGLATKSVFVANAPGIVDPDYTGEIFILLHNSGFETCWIEHEHRIAQAILLPICDATLQEIKDPPMSSGRGAAGFGSTGA